MSREAAPLCNLTEETEEVRRLKAEVRQLRAEAAAYACACMSGRKCQRVPCVYGGGSNTAETARNCP